jgi:hypothetical protein
MNIILHRKIVENKTLTPHFLYPPHSAAATPIQPSLSLTLAFSISTFELYLSLNNVICSVLCWMCVACTTCAEYWTYIFVCWLYLILANLAWWFEMPLKYQINIVCPISRCEHYFNAIEVNSFLFCRKHNSIQLYFAVFFSLLVFSKVYK